jgi:acyl-CoA dehydrogenase
VRDTGLSLSFGEIFAVIVYGQLILEQARLCEVEEDLIDVVFDTLVRDLSAQAVEPLGNHGVTEARVIGPNG